MSNYFKFLLTLVLASLLSHATVSDTSLLLWLPLDEGSGSHVNDRSMNQLEVEVFNAQWAKGENSAALYMGGTNAVVYIPPVPGLEEAENFTIALWATWDDNEPRHYPNLLTSKTWCPGGFMFFVSDLRCAARIGRHTANPDNPDAKWLEKGANVFSKVPHKKWTHLCVTFARPLVRTYANGELASEIKWDYPLQTDGFKLGSWNQRVSHKGLLSDLRIYNRALTAIEVATLAETKKDDPANYSLVPETPAFQLVNRYSTLELSSSGHIISLRSNITEHELLDYPYPFASLELEDGREVNVHTLTTSGAELQLGFTDNAGRVVIEAHALDNFHFFKIRSIDVPGLKKLNICRIPVANVKYRGNMANMLSNDEDGVCLRAYDLPLEMSLRHNMLQLSATDELGCAGWRAGLAVGPKAEMGAILRDMTFHAGVPRSVNGGAWSMDSKATRGSYLFADLHHSATDAWISTALRGGFSYIHLHGWWSSLGHYNIRQALYPNGLSDLQDSVNRIHGAGLKAGFHTLTACISPSDPWVTPEPSPYLLPSATYTLAENLDPAATVFYVKEKPIDGHDTVFTYSGNGNAIRIGKEIIQYQSFSQTPPYRFEQCKRGAFGTQPAAHAAGTKADYLQQRYIAFYPDPDSPLADELAERIANVFNTCNINMLYFDGSEGMRSRYGIDTMRHKIMGKLQGSPIIEASCGGAHNWWFHSRLGTWDHPVWGMKIFQDSHIKSCQQHRKSDLLNSQMGWWSPRMASKIARGHFLDEMEYFAAKNMGFNAAMSIQGINVNNASLPYNIERQITLLGWYERLRLANYFDEPTIARVAIPGAEVQLRQKPDGHWDFIPITVFKKRFANPEQASQEWQIDNPAPSSTSGLRFEALYTADSTKPLTTTAILGDNPVPSMVKTANQKISLQFQHGAEQPPQLNTSAYRLQAINTTDSATGAWAVAEFNFADPYKNLRGVGALGFWVKGDGSGTLLNIQLASPREFMGGASEHYVKVDFTGWRYVELLIRERDIEQMQDYVWPYSSAISSYRFARTGLNMQHISQISLYLNEIPAQGSSDIIVAELQGYAAAKTRVENPAITLNKQMIKIPFSLESGEFVELDNQGLLTHYNEHGTPLAYAVVQASSCPILVPGLNTIQYSGGRAELTLFATGTPFGVPRNANEIAWEHLQREYDMPQILLASDTAKGWEWSSIVRQGTRAKLELEIVGAVTEPELNIADKSIKFPVVLNKGERLICSDQLAWRVFDAEHKVRTQGRLELAIVPQTGVIKFGFKGQDFEAVTVKICKLYQ